MKMDVFVTIEESETEQIADAITVEGDRRVPVEPLERALLGEARFVDAELEALVLASIDLVLQHELEEVLSVRAWSSWRRPSDRARCAGPAKASDA